MGSSGGVSRILAAKIARQAITKIDRTMRGATTRPQFGLGALLWTTGVVALTLAYMQRFDGLDIFLNAGIALVGAFLAGIAVGAITGQMADTTYWATVIAAAVYLAVIADPRFDPVFHLAWAAVGGAVGASVGAVQGNRPIRRVVVGCLAGATPMALFVQAGWMHDGWFDWLCAAVIGGVAGLLVEVILRLEAHHSMARYVTAAWLLLAVMAGNLMVSWLVVRPGS